MAYMHILLLIFFAMVICQYGWIKGPLVFAGSWIAGVIIGFILFFVGLALLLALAGAGSR